MKKQIKRIGALVLAGVLALGMSVTALAGSDMDSANPTGVLGDFESADTTVASIAESVILLKK